MRILHINSYFVTGPFYENIFSFQRKENDVIVYVHKEKNKYRAFSNPNCVVSSPYNKFQKLFYFFKHRLIYKDLKRNINVDNIDVVHAHSLFSNGFEAYKLNVEFGIPYVVAIRNSDVNFFFKYFFHLRTIARKILLNASAIVFISNSYKQNFVRKMPKKDRDSLLEKAIVLPNGIDDFWLDNRSKRCEETTKIIKLLCVGNVDKNKNALLICKAINFLKRSGIDCDLTLVGRIRDDSIFRKLTAYDFVKYHEPVPKESLIDYYKNADIFVMPSIHETFGLVYAEAMTQGLPVIYTRDQGFDGQFEEGFVGYSVDSDDYIELATNIKRIMNDYLRISNNAYDVSKQYNWLIINQKYLNIYRNLKGE